MLKLVIIITVFLLILYLILHKKNVEGFNINSPTNCPNVLIQKGNTFVLYNTYKAKVPGVNPIIFKNLEDYTEFINWQRSQGIRCPILFLRESKDIQGNKVYTSYPSPDSDYPSLMPEPVSKLIDANRDNYPYNYNMYPGYDENNQYIGLNTPLDQMFHEPSNVISDNPMDPNWGGAAYTQSLVNKGYYKGDKVKIRIPN